MSLSFLNTYASILSVAIYPDRLAWVYKSSGFKKNVLAHGQSSCSVNMESPWSNVIALLPKLLANTEIQATKVRVLISNRLLRFGIVPNPDSTKNQEELDLLVNHVFQRIYGDKVNGWKTRLSDAGVGQPALACALDSEMLDLIASIIKDAGKELISLQPYLMAAYNRIDHLYPTAPKNADQIFVIAEPFRLCLLAKKDQGWIAVQQFNVEQDCWEQLLEKITCLMIQTDMPNCKKITIATLEISDNYESFQKNILSSGLLNNKQFQFIDLDDVAGGQGNGKYSGALLA